MFQTTRSGLAGIALAASIAVLLPHAAQAAVVENDTNTSTGFTVSSTDLINGFAPSAGSTSPFGDDEGLGTDTTGAALTNGAFGPTGLTAAPNSDVTDIHTGNVIIYTLTNPSTINEIDTYTGWRDSGRSKQDYTVSFSTDGVTFSAPIFTVNSITGVNGNTSPGDDIKVAITDNTSAPLGTGIKAIEFNFPIVQNGYVGYREIDVLGTAVPEPSTVAAIIGGAGMLLGLRRRRA